MPEIEKVNNPLIRECIRGIQTYDRAINYFCKRIIIETKNKKVFLLVGQKRLFPEEVRATLKEYDQTIMTLRTNLDAAVSIAACFKRKLEEIVGLDRLIGLIS